MPSTPDRKYRIAFVKDFIEASPEDVKYVYASTEEEAAEIMKKMSREGKYQSDQGGHLPGLPHVAVLEAWNDDEQDWLSVVGG